MTIRRGSPPASTATGTLFLVATPIGNLRDVTLRALDVLAEVTLIAAEDTRRTAKLLGHYGITTPQQSLHAHNEFRRVDRLLDRLRAGESIAVVSDAGTPLISDPGRELVARAVDAGIPVRAVPGASAVLSAYTASGLAADQFTFAGFPPHRSNDRKKWLEELGSEPRPVVLYEAPHRIARTLADIEAVLGDREVAVCREATKIHEELVKGPISEVSKALSEPRGEFTVVVAPRPAPVEGTGAPPSAETVLHKLGQLIENGSSKRDAVRQIADQHGIRSQEVYRVLRESGDKEGQST